VKHLWIVRHAKAVAAQPGEADHGRMLSERGIADARRAAVLLAPHFPAATAVSDAARTRETAECIVPPECIEVLDVRSAGYHASARVWLDWISTWDDDYARGVLFGHNPGTSDLVELLTGARVELPTCGIAEIELPIDSWLDAAPGRGKLRLLWTPASLFHG
jgi:phosphohistidine phosphatase